MGGGGAGLGPRDMGGWAAIRRVVVDAAVGGRACGGLLCPSAGASLVPREAGGGDSRGRCGGGGPPVELARPVERAAPPELMRRKM